MMDLVRCRDAELVESDGDYYDLLLLLPDPS